MCRLGVTTQPPPQARAGRRLRHAIVATSRSSSFSSRKNYYAFVALVDANGYDNPNLGTQLGGQTSVTGWLASESGTRTLTFMFDNLTIATVGTFRFEVSLYEQPSNLASPPRCLDTTITSQCEVAR
jgi:hypothetical protein